MNILKTIMDMGVLVEPVAAEYLAKINEKEAEKIVERVRNEKPLVLGENFFVNVFDVIEKKIEERKYSVQEMAGSYNKFYQMMSGFFVKKKNTVSISNAFGDVSVIGIVKDVKVSEADVEDPTGVIKVKLNDEVKLINDEVILVSGAVKNRVLYAEFVEYPNIKSTPKISGKECIVCLNGGRGDYNIFFGDETKIEKDSLIVSSNPVYVKVNNITILVFRTDDPLSVLKKRSFYPDKMNEENILDEVPDYFLTAGSEVKDYNGVKIVGIDEKTSARIELHTGKVEIVGK